MKKIMYGIVASLLATSAIASPLFSGQSTFSFKAENDMACSLTEVSDKEAPLIFHEIHFGNDNSYVTAKISTGHSSKIHTHVNGWWVNASGWNWKNPDVVVMTKFNDKDIKHENTIVFNSSYEVDQGKELTYKMAVKADPMTHKGTGHLDMLVQFYCE